MVTQEQMEQYHTEGYFVADNPPPDLEELVAAGKRVKAKVRAGEVAVYPHWAGAGEPWCIRGLLAPEMGEPIFANHMISDWALDYSRAFIGAEMRLGWIDLRGLLKSLERQQSDVLNGIAYDPKTKRIFVTGKLWPWVFQIELIGDR